MDYMKITSMSNENRKTLWRMVGVDKRSLILFCPSELRCLFAIGLANARKDECGWKRSLNTIRSFWCSLSSSWHFKRIKLLCRSSHRYFYQGFLFGCLSSLFFDFCFSFSTFCFWPFSLSFLPPLSPMTSLLFLFSEISSPCVVSVSTTVDLSFSVTTLHTFQNPSITAFRKFVLPGSILFYYLYFCPPGNQLCYNTDGDHCGRAGLGGLPPDRFRQPAAVSPWHLTAKYGKITEVRREQWKTKRIWRHPVYWTASTSTFTRAILQMNFGYLTPSLHTTGHTG